MKLTKNELRTNLTVIKDSLINNIETTEITYGESETIWYIKVKQDLIGSRVL